MQVMSNAARKELHELIDRLPEKSLLIGDRYYGVPKADVDAWAERERERLLGEVFARVAPEELGAFHQAIKRASLKSAASWRDELRKFVERGHRLLDVLPDLDGADCIVVCAGMDAALAELEKGKGNAFDPEVVDTAVRMVREKGYLLPA